MSGTGVGRTWWDAAYQHQGHTGWADRQVYAYDQPLRRRAIARVVRELHPRGLRDGAAIDVGCGTGDFTALLAAAGARVLAFDFSRNVLGAARQRADAARADFCCASAVHMPVATGAASIVTCVTVLQHLVDQRDWESAIAELRRVLRSDGSVVLLELAPPLTASNLASDGHVIERPPQAWRAALEAGGLCIAREAPYPQWGISLLRGLARAIDSVRGRASETPEKTVSSGARDATLGRRLLRTGLRLVRTAVLAFAWPLDRLGFQVPISHRYYRLWVLQPAERGV